MKKIFSYNSDINKTAYLNWRTMHHQPIHNMNVLAEGYFDSAILLSKCCLEDNNDKKADVIIFPMLFSLNHGIELYVKSICWSLNILLDSEKKFKKSHNIKEIWEIAKGKIKTFGFANDRPRETFEEMIIVLDNYLDELTSKIKTDETNNNAYKNIDFSRYPMNKSYKCHFYLQTFDNVPVDLENFIEVTANIKNCLNLLSGYYYEKVLEKWNQ